MDDGIDEQRGGLKRRLPGCFIIDGKYQKQSRFWWGEGNWSLASSWRGIFEKYPL